MDCLIFRTAHAVEIVLFFSSREEAKSSRGQNRATLDRAGENEGAQVHTLSGGPAATPGHQPQSAFSISVGPCALPVSICL